MMSANLVARAWPRRLTAARARGFSTNWSGAGTVHTARYPLHEPMSPKYADVVARGREALATTGCASFPDFFNSAALEVAAASAQASVDDAFVTDSTHNAYQLPDPDPALPQNHVRNQMMRTKVASTAYDELPRDGPLYSLYNSDVFRQFVSDITSRSLFRVADPLGAASINIFRPGWFHAWHFDESEFTTTLCLQQSDEGGEFEYTAALRNTAEDLVSPLVAELINERSAYDVVGGGEDDDDGDTSTAVNVASFEPGTLQIFAGRYSLHHVKRIPQDAKTDRLVAVLCFATEPNVMNSPSVQQMFWGRTVEVEEGHTA